MSRFTATVVESVTTSTETLLQLLAATNHPIKIQRILISGNSNTPGNTPTQFDVLRQTGAGTSSSLTLVKVDSGGDTLDTTALQDFSAEPTPGDVLLSRYVHPIGGAEIVFPPGRELVVRAGERLGVRVVTPTQSNSWAVTVEAEE